MKNSHTWPRPRPFLEREDSSSVPSVFLGLKGLKAEKRGEKGRKGTNALYYYGMREATNHPFVCPVCLQKKFVCPVCLQKKFVCPVCFSFISAVCINDAMD